MYTIRNKGILEETVKAVVNTHYPAMTASGRRMVERSLVHKRFVKRTLLLDEGETANEIFIVGKGLLRQFCRKNGREVTTGFACEGEVAISAESLLLQKPSAQLVETLEVSLVYTWPYDELIQLCRQEPEVATLYRHILENLLAKAQSNSYAWKFESAIDRYREFLRTRGDIVRRAPLNDIASFLAMTPETLSRMRAEVRSQS